MKLSIARYFPGRYNFQNNLISFKLFLNIILEDFLFVYWLLFENILISHQGKYNNKVFYIITL